MRDIGDGIIIVELRIFLSLGTCGTVGFRGTQFEERRVKVMAAKLQGI
jgi:hypothetical protein